MEFIDDKNKHLTYWNRNYMFIVTFLIVGINILLFVLLGNSFINENLGGKHVWYSFDLSNLLRGFLNAFEHADFEHVLLNMLCFLGCGLYIERKTGSLGFLFLIFGFCILDSAFGIATSYSVNYHGASGIIYLCYAYIIIDYIFSFYKTKKNKLNIIFGAIVLGLMLFAMCFDSYTDGFPFTYYPKDLITNAGHYSSFLCGIIVTLIMQIARVYVLKNSQPIEKENKKVNKKIYIAPIIVIGLILISCPILSIMTANTKTYTVTFDCNIDKFDKSFEFNAVDDSAYLHNFRYEYFYAFSAEEKSGYFYKIYEDSNYTKEVTDSCLFSFDLKHVPLAYKNKTYYVKMIEGYEVYISYNDLLTYFSNQNVISDDLGETKNVYSFGGSGGATETLYVEKGQDCTFSLPYLRPDLAPGKLTVHADGQVLEANNGEYTIKNVTRPIHVTFEYNA